MDNFELHEAATRLADNHSAYELARMLLIEQKERAELAAHVERVKELVEGHRMKGMMSTSRPAFSREMWEWYQEAPASSLARRDLIKQAEVLEDIAAVLKKNRHDDAAQTARIKAHANRQQASQLEKNQ